MKKILAVALMATSIGAIASPKSCLLGWAATQGADVTQYVSHVSKWGPQGEFDWTKSGLLIQYTIKLSKNSVTDDEAAKGPWDCHCTVIKGTVPSGADIGGYVTGLCGIW